MGALDGHRALFLWMFSTQAEQNITAACQTAQHYAGADVILVKAMDGQTWMGDIDPAPAAIHSAQELVAMQQEAAALGVTVVPWVVATNRVDAIAHGGLGPVLVVDLEPYAGFWQDTPTGVLQYIAVLRNLGVKELYISIDPRSSASSALGMEQWASKVDGLLPQCYWTDFQQPEAVIHPLLDAEVGLLHSHVFPVLPYNGAPADLQAAWEYAKYDGCTGVVLWRLGSADAAQLQTFAGLPLVPPKPVPTNDDFEQMHRLVDAQPFDAAALVAYAGRFA